MLVSRALYARSKALGLATIVGSLSALNPALVLLSHQARLEIPHTQGYDLEQ